MLANTPLLFKKDQTVYIVGGGASLTGFDFKLLEDKQCIVINRAYKNLPDAAALFFADRNFYEHHGDTIWRFKGRKFTTIKNFDNKYGVKDIEVLEPLDIALPDDKECESGVQAISFAIQAGAGTIILLGFDGCYTNNRKNFYSEHNDSIPLDIFSKPLKDYEELAEELKPFSDLKVFNANEKSAIKSFPFLPLCDALNYDSLSKSAPIEEPKKKKKKDSQEE